MKKQHIKHGNNICQGNNICHNVKCIHIFKAIKSAYMYGNNTNHT